MPSKIRVLDENTINKIAAGEVIENPSSVVKELVENAVDAGSTEITIEIKGGGRQLIRISDNGCGMGRDDALLSLERHATSKIRHIEDIYSINTMGFRGEAVPAIASVSKLTLLTHVEGEKEGTLIMVDGGNLAGCGSAVRPPGTTFEVKSLFFNLPVRKKFQRSPAYDTAEILRIITNQALANPRIKFHLISNEKTLLNAKMPQKTNSLEQIGERIADVLGSDFFSGLCPIEKEIGDYKIFGYAGLPHYSRHNRTGQYLLINKRAVMSSAISFAMKEAYGTTLGTNRHPVFVLYIDMNGSLVDVNVHPQKKEVRLRHQFELKEMLVKAVEEALQQSGMACGPLLSTSAEPPSDFTYSAPFVIQERVWRPLEAEASSLPSFIREEKKSLFEPFLFEEQPIRPSSSSLKVIATLPGYIMLSSSDGVVQLLDQRAAHARVLYEQVERGSAKNTLPVQRLLIPETLSFPVEEAIVLKSFLDYMDDLGFQIREVKDNCFILQGIPVIFDISEARDILLGIIHELKDHQQENVAALGIKRKMIQIVSREAFSKNHRLSTLEAQALYDQLMQCGSPFSCPGGKPTLVTLSQEELAKHFQKY